MMNRLKQVSLKWDCFQDKIGSFLKDAKRSGDFSDVTLVCGDGKQIEAHRIILASASPFFETIFRKDTHPHPLIYIKGLNSAEVEQVLHFMYFGEVSIAEDQLEAFLALAEDFHLNAFQSSTDHKSMGQCGKSELTQYASTEVAGKYFEKEKVDKTSKKVKVDKSSEKVKVDTFSEKVNKYSEKVTVDTFSEKEKVDKSSEKMKVDNTPSELIRLKTELQVVTSQVARKAKEVTTKVFPHFSFPPQNKEMMALIGRLMEEKSSLKKGSAVLLKEMGALKKQTEK